MLEFDAVLGVLEAAVAVAVPGYRFAGVAAARQRGRGEQPAIVLVAHVQHFLRRVGHRVVGPRRDRVALAVLRPGVGTPRLGGGEAEIGIGADVEPGHRRQRAVSSEKTPSELPSTMRSTYRVFRLEKKT